MNFILIPGRSSRQGVTLNEGKYTDGYLDETSTLRMHPDDMSRLELSPGDSVRMWNDIGEVVVPVINAGDECPEGLVFICYGDKSSQLMGGETHGSGMPDSKGLDVTIERHSPVVEDLSPQLIANVGNPVPDAPTDAGHRTSAPVEGNSAPSTGLQVIMTIVVALALLAALLLAASH